MDAIRRPDVEPALTSRCQANPEGRILLGRRKHGPQLAVHQQIHGVLKSAVDHALLWSPEVDLESHGKRLQRHVVLKSSERPL
jgi:hypothetical protein